MEQELKVMLELIIRNQESLQSDVNARFDDVNARIDDVNARFDDVNARFDKVDNDLTMITMQLEKLEANTNSDVIAMLELMDSKLELTATKEDINFLAMKLGKHELEIDRLKRIG
jgi:chromosome segregation ATPase